MISHHERLLDVDDRLVRVVKRIKMDISVVCGFRGEQEQNQAFREGRSKVEFPHSQHNWNPSRAVDIVPTSTLYSNEQMLFLLAGAMYQAAAEESVTIRWGGNWSGNLNNYTRPSFFDAAHFEIGPEEVRT